MITSGNLESVDFLQELSLEETSKKNITDKTFITLNKKNLRVKNGLEAGLFNSELCENNDINFPKNFIESDSPTYCQKSNKI